MLITKSTFLTYRHCPSDFWYLNHQREQWQAKRVDDFAQLLIDQGYEVEECAYDLFPDIVVGGAMGHHHGSFTKIQMDEGHKCIAQAGFTHDDLFVRVDILDYNDLYGGWDIFEVKSTSRSDNRDTRQEHLEDAAFQYHVLTSKGMTVNNVYLVELNKEYVRDGDIDPAELLKTTEVTTEILKLQATIEADVAHAKAILASAIPPTECQCRYLGAKHHCASYRTIYPDAPDYTIHHLQNIGQSKKKLAAMVDEGIQHLSDVRADHKLSVKQMNQIDVYINDDIIIDHNGVSDELALLEYPLYFLDYETSAPAIPAFDGTWPYQQVPFQYSLHIQQEVDGPYEHREFLHLGSDNPIPHLVQKLRADIGDTGSVIVWYKHFEGPRNKEMAKFLPEHADFLLDINNRMYDLMDIFSKQYYVHKDFKGSTSIKYVLPVLCPELSYEDLFIPNGGTATTLWRKMIFGKLSQAEKDEITEGLLAYCQLDTWAMVRILSSVAKAMED